MKWFTAGVFFFSKVSLSKKIRLDAALFHILNTVLSLKKIQFAAACFLFSVE